MYWRIRKIGPEEIARQYGVHAMLIVSLLFNFFFFTRINASKAMAPTIKNDFDKFARVVTEHLFDANYLTVTDSMQALNGELVSKAMKKLVQIGLIPPTADELRAVARQMEDSKSVSCVKFEEVKTVQEPGPTTPLIMDCSIKVVVHDSQGVRPSSFKVRYWLGQIEDNKTKERKPIVLDAQIQELAANPAGSN